MTPRPVLPSVPNDAVSSIKILNLYLYLSSICRYIQIDFQVRKQKNIPDFKMQIPFSGDYIYHHNSSRDLQRPEIFELPWLSLDSWCRHLLVLWAIGLDRRYHCVWRILYYCVMQSDPFVWQNVRLYRKIWHHRVSNKPVWHWRLSRIHTSI